MLKLFRVGYNPLILLLLICIIYFGIISFLFYKQVIVGGDTQSRIVFRGGKLFDRGDIYFTDRDGNRYLMATTYVGKNLVISPRELGDLPETYEHLNTEIPLDQEEFFIRAKKENDAHEVLATRLEDDVAQKLALRINRYNLKGVYLEDQPWRFYPWNNLGSHILGFVGFNDEGEFKGQYGLENQYDDVLSKAPGISKNFTSLLISLLKRQKAEGISGSNITASIDFNVQRKLEEVISKNRNFWNANKVGAVILDPNTGKVVALANAPDFDPNIRQENVSVFNNAIVEDLYEMGSVFKAITVAIGLDSTKIDADFTYNDIGKISADGETIYNYDKKGRGPNVGLSKILRQSLNTGAATVLLETGKDTYRNYLSAFRFFDTTGIDLPREIPGNVRNLNSPRTIEYITASYGHGIAVTPIAAARAFSSLANGGRIVRPYIVENIEQSINISTAVISPKGSNPRSSVDRVFKKESTDEVNSLLIEAFDFGVAGGTLRNKRYSIGAKTGTAFRLDENTGRYSEDEYFHSFFGYLPASDPKFLIFLFSVNPKAEFASTTLAPPFKELTDYLISYYALPPDR